jgi:hypothetical protein
MADPVRLQLSRKAGFNLHDASLALNGLPAISVARPGKWGNPFKVGEDGTAAECVDLYRCLLAGYVALTTKASTELQTKTRAVVVACLDELRGKNLACWCRKDKPCHADVLLEIANREQVNG